QRVGAPWIVVPDHQPERGPRVSCSASPSSKIKLLRTSIRNAAAAVGCGGKFLSKSRRRREKVSAQPPLALRQARRPPSTLSAIAGPPGGSAHVARSAGT